MKSRGLIFEDEYKELLYEDLKEKITQLDVDQVKMKVELSNALLEGSVAFVNYWDMEECQQYYKIPKDWITAINGDGEWIYALNRMEYLPALILMFYQNRDMKYIDCWNNLILSRSGAENKYLLMNRRVRSIINKVLRKTIGQRKYEMDRTLDTAIRIYIQSSCLLFISEHISDSQKETIIKKIFEDIEHLKRNFRKFDETSNWGAIILSAQLIALCILSDNLINIKNTIDRTVAKLIMVLENQLSPSGVQDEGSTMYHTQVAIFVYKAIYYLNAVGYDTTERLVDICSKMSNFIFYITPDDNVQIPFGDSDCTNLDSIFWLFGHIDFDRVHKHDFNLCFDIIDQYRVVIKNEAYHERNISYFADAGIGRITKDAWLLYGFNSDHRSGHSHADMGEVVAYYNGLPLFTDSGRYSYQNCDLRVNLKSPHAHTVPIVSNGDDWNMIDAWVCNKKPNQQAIGVASFDNISVITMKYESTIKSEKIIICRTAILIKEKLIIIDFGISEGNVEFNMGQNFIVPDFWNIKTEKDCTQMISDRNTIIMSSTLAIKVDDTIISHKYNEKARAKKMFGNGSDSFAVSVLTGASMIIDVLQNRNTLLLTLYNNKMKIENKFSIVYSNDIVCVEANGMEYKIYMEELKDASRRSFN